MTKNLLILSLFFLSVSKLNAQCTPDNTITKAGFYPMVLPDAILNTPYNKVMQFKILKDTTIMYMGFPVKATVDSAIVKEVYGMPNGMAFQLNKASKSYTPAEVGCALVAGTPTVTGTFELGVVLKIFAKVGSFAADRTDTIKNFSIVVRKDASINDLHLFSKIIYPNPLTGDVLNINTDLVSPGAILNIYNCQGQLVNSYYLEGSEKTIGFAYPKGLYLISINSNDKVIHSKLLKE